MGSSFLLQAVALLAPAFAAPLANRALAQAGAPDFAVSTAWTDVLHDEPGDGRLWSAGATWKASFGAEGATYYPRAGSTESRRLPHALSPDRVTLGGAPLAFERCARPSRDGDRVELDRGAFTERYDLGADSIEQSFVFDALPRAGELVLRIPVASELDGVETTGGLEFRSERGRITYSRAVVVDARWRRTDVDTRLEDGAIVVRVGADVLAGAALPIVVDPLLGAFFPEITSEDTFSLDAAFDPVSNVWVVVYERVFSASDHDVVAKMYSAGGGFLSTAIVDVTSDSWTRPRIADLAPERKFLVVAGATLAVGGWRTVRGRMLQPNGGLLTTEPQVPISGTHTDDCVLPDVGGHSDDNVPSAWCVVFERGTSGSEHRIEYCLVSLWGTVVSGPFTMPSVPGTSDTQPTISRSSGGTAWTVAWVRAGFPQETVRAARVSPWLELLAGPVFAGNGPFAGAPCASSPITGTDLSAIAWQRGLPVGSLDAQVIVTLLDGVTVLQIEDLAVLEGVAPAAAHQTAPSIDSDGRHFLVAYSQLDTAPFPHSKLFVTDLAVSGTTLQVSQSHLEVQPAIGLTQTRSNVAAARAPAPLAQRYVVVYDVEQSAANHDGAARLVDGEIGGPSNGFCSGDGTGAACPCGNSGGAGRGCANSVNATGARLALSAGRASTLADSAVVQTAGVPPGAAVLLFQGTTAGAGTAFGDGLRCATGSVTRIGTSTADGAGVTSYPDLGDPSISAAGFVPVAGGMRTYQSWYRNAASFCTSSTFNLSNGLAIHWAR